MDISRRRLIGAATALAAANLARPLKASLISENWQGLSSILGKRWYGAGITRTAGTDDGKLSLQLGLTLEPHDDLTVGGTLRLTSRWETGTYSANYRISAHVTSTDEPAIFVVIDNASYDSGDDLPSSLYWQGLTGSLRLYTERGNDGHWMLSGDLYGTRDGNKFESQFSDHPD